MKFPAMLLLLSFGLGLAGCGQKGPLYLPSEKPEQGSGSKQLQSQNPADAS